jgi:hypothetical protein
MMIGVPPIGTRKFLLPKFVKGMCRWHGNSEPYCAHKFVSGQYVVQNSPILTNSPTISGLSHFYRTHIRAIVGSAKTSGNPESTSCLIIALDGDLINKIGSSENTEHRTPNTDSSFRIGGLDGGRILSSSYKIVANATHH